MSKNVFFKMLCSLPIILVLLYFIPFLGICLILFRYYIYRTKSYYTTPICLTICGLLITIPKLVNWVLSFLNISNIGGFNLESVVSSSIYISLLNYSKLLITVGIIFLILSFAISNVYRKLNSKIVNYIQKDLQKDYEIREKNDLKMQEKRERAKNTHIVNCPYCGADNVITDSVGYCKFCRKPIGYKS